MNFYYPSADVRINDNINEHITCIKIIEHLSSEALTGILVHKIYMQIKQYMNIKNCKNNKENRNNENISSVIYIVT